ncbi:MAG: MFS transporter [Lactococcus sp.]|uniref:Major facilitator superfamily transporter, efflux protein n=2 Tax=Pseudolactococcus TaxID=3436058 RepID=A0A0D6DY33_9LACT|nr:MULTISPECIES: MFS transporter [Lactococcus]MCJ1971540.1 MFS transporter [Lactococcus carnosus]MCJ1988720.1 MFS transporter [Lactococcus carnosus]MDN5403348.1 MFS transporter [Lactococcus sp.]MDN5409889.1 MFS transporter [Lactococcus sp.]MDN5411947.1 MFS transporter [Lactococcus sp.]
MKKISILWLSFFPLLAGAALSPSLSEISQTFPTVSNLWLKSLITIPSICVVLGQVVQPKLSRKITAKTQVLGGLFLYALGALPYIWPSFPIIILSRILLGIGLSLLVPHTIGLIQANFEGKIQKKLLGYASALNNFGTVVAVIYAGLVSNKDWRLVFLIYLLAIISLVTIYLFLPNDKQEVTSPKQATNEKVPYNVVRIWLKMFLLTVIYFTIPTNLAFYMHDHFQQQGTLIIGILMAITSLFGVISGMIFSYFPGRKNSQVQELILIGLFLISMCLLSFTQTLPLFILGLLFSGWGLGWGLPCFNHQLISTLTHPSSATLGIGQAMIFLGQFVSPFLIAFMSNLSHQDNPFLMSLILLGVLLGIAMLDFSKNQPTMDR